MSPTLLLFATLISWYSSPAVLSVSSRLSIPGGCLGVCIQSGFILRAGSSLPQATQLVALTSPRTPCSWVAVPTNCEYHRRDPLPKAASPWVDQALELAMLAPLWAQPQSRGGQRVLGCRNHRLCAQLPHNGEIKPFGESYSTCLAHVEQLGEDVGSLSFHQITIAADLDPEPLGQTSVWVALPAGDRDCLSPCCFLLSRGNRTGW